MAYPSRMSFSGMIRNRSKVYHDGLARQKISEFVTAHDGQDFVETIEAVKDAKTTQQLAFFHGPLVSSFMEITGNASKSAVKLYLKEEFLGNEAVVNEKRVVVIPSLASLSKKRMREFIDNCMNLLYELGGDLTVEGRNEYRIITGGVNEH